MRYVYLLECADGSLYVGSTWNLETRVDQHNSGLGAKYTETRRPVKLIWYEEFERIDEAHALERRIHGWGRAKRRALAERRFGDLRRLARGHDRGDP